MSMSVNGCQQASGIKEHWPSTSKRRKKSFNLQFDKMKFYCFSKFCFFGVLLDYIRLRIVKFLTTKCIKSVVDVNSRTFLGQRWQTAFFYWSMLTGCIFYWSMSNKKSAAVNVDGTLNNYFQARHIWHMCVLAIHTLFIMIAICYNVFS